MMNMAYMGIILSISILATFAFIPIADARVLTVDTDKHTFYQTGETIIFTGTTDYSPDLITIVIYGPEDDDGERELIAVDSAISTKDLTFQSQGVDLQSAKFNQQGIYLATAFLNNGEQPFEEGVAVMFDFSVDGSPVTPSAYGPTLTLKSLNDLTINEESKFVFTAVLDETYTGSENLIFSLDDDPPSGATINPSTGVFSWTPSESQGPGTYTFDIVVKAGTEEDSESITITVNEVDDVIPPPPVSEPEPNVPDFIDPKKGPQYYLDRYANEPAYKDWFDTYYPDYTIEEAIELAIPDAFSESEPARSSIPDFIDPEKGAQHYLDRYNNEPAYKQWFDRTYPDYTIEEAIELAIPGSFNEPSPKKLAPFVDPKQDPQYYIDRYANEPAYKQWFDEQFPDMTIYEAVGVEPPKTGICGKGTHLEDGECVADIQKSGGGCLIATAAYGSEMSQQVQFLREIRDNTILKTNSGTSFMANFNSLYYSFSPTIADWERQSPLFKKIIQVGIVPLLTSLSLLNAADIDTEEEMLGYGIGVIMLNVGMYIIGPTFAVLTARKFLIK